MFVLVDLARIQCVSTSTCERAFNVQILIKTRVRHNLGSKNLEVVLEIALKGLVENFDNIIEDAIFCGKIKPNTGFYILILHFMCLLQVMHLVW